MTRIDCTRLDGAIYVAVLATPDFDALDVDYTTVTFEGATDAHTNPRTGIAIRRAVDVDPDGDLDLLFKFALGDTQLTCESTQGTLIGEIREGLEIVGTDSLWMVSH